MLDQRVILICTVWCVPFFTENPLFIFNKILTIIMYIPPTFPFFFYDKNWLFSYVFLLSFLLWCLCHNYYKYLAIEEKKGASEGVVPPQKPGLPTFRNCLEGETLSAKRKNPRVGSRPAYIVYRAPDGVQGQSPWQGSKASFLCVTKNILSEVKCIISGPSVV